MVRKREVITVGESLLHGAEEDAGLHLEDAVGGRALEDALLRGLSGEETVVCVVLLGDVEVVLQLLAVVEVADLDLAEILGALRDIVRAAALDALLCDEVFALALLRERLARTVHVVDAVPIRALHHVRHERVLAVRCRVLAAQPVLVLQRLALAGQARLFLEDAVVLLAVVHAVVLRAVSVFEHACLRLGL